MVLAVIFVTVIAGLLLLFFPATKESTIPAPTIVNMGSQPIAQTTSDETITVDENIKEVSADSLRGEITSQENGIILMHIKKRTGAKARDIRITLTESTRIERLVTSSVHLPGEIPKAEIMEISATDLQIGNVIVVYTGSDIPENAIEVTATKIEQLQ